MSGGRPIDTLWVALLGLVALAGAGLGLRARLNRPVPEAPDRALFRTDLPAWQLARHRGAADAGALLQAHVGTWPALAQALAGLDHAWPERPAVLAAAKEVNRATRAAGLTYWLDAEEIDDQVVLLTYDLQGSARWRCGERSVEVLRVRRLDGLNVELGFLGQVEGEQPVVLEEMIEGDVLALLGEGGRTANDADRAARRLWRAAVSSRVGAETMALALSKAGALLQAEAVVDDALLSTPVRAEWPDAFRFSEVERTSLRQLPRPPVQPAMVDAVLAAERGLGEPRASAALVALRELEAARVEAHEARHALEPEHLPVPAALHDLADAEAEFENMAESELRAYLGEVQDSAAPPCLGVVKLLRNAAGAPGRETPHHFASRLALAELAPGAEPVAAAEALCGLPEAELRRRAGEVYARLFARPLVPARRE